MKNLKVVLSVFAAVVLCCISLLIYFLVRPSELVDSGLSYSESTHYIANPGAGFYFTYPVKLKNNNNEDVKTWIFSRLGDRKYSLMHLRVDIGDFSANASGADRDISPQALDLINQIFTHAKNANIEIIFRMAYSWPDGAYVNAEPSLPWMKRHIEQMGELLSNHPDTLAAIETGMLGPWGEQHSTAAVTPDNLYEITKAWLNATPSLTTTVSLRRPSYFLHWYNRHYNTNIDIGNIDKIPPSEKGTPEYRVGVFNDGILGHGSDSGTFSNREKEILWLGNQAQHTLYGGEAVIGASFAQLEVEGFKKNLSYLNIEHYIGLIAEWRNSQYDGDDDLYKSKTQLEFMENHLGYRFVLRDSKISQNVKTGQKLVFKGKIENIGFAPLIIDTKTSITLVDSDGTVTSFNVTFNPNDGDYDITLKPESLPKGNYTAYMCFSNGIEFANDPNNFCSDIKGNKLGNFTII